MNKRWILFLIPLSLTIIATTASAQTSQLSNAGISSGNQQPQNNSFLPDTIFAPDSTDSTYANLQVGWDKAPGQMPIYFFGLPPNSMPILMLPPVDEKMIIPITSEEADSLNTSNQDDE